MEILIKIELKLSLNKILKHWFKIILLDLLYDIEIYSTVLRLT